eukprot:GFUD01065802.1.p1 GENE.GFUD01065802.1~~GFUD01065802.1.p1  ORF type:complete len:114 (-),score=19.25 GFUD01065802.1:25-366(-)
MASSTTETIVVKAEESNSQPRILTLRLTLKQDDFRKRCKESKAKIVQGIKKIKSKKITSGKINFTQGLDDQKDYLINDGSMKEGVGLDEEELQVHVQCFLQYIFHRSLYLISC